MYVVSDAFVPSLKLSFKSTYCTLFLSITCCRYIKYECGNHHQHISALRDAFHFLSSIIIFISKKLLFTNCAEMNELLNCIFFFSVFPSSRHFFLIDVPSLLNQKSFLWVLSSPQLVYIMLMHMGGANKISRLFPK